MVITDKSKQASLILVTDCTSVIPKLYYERTYLALVLFKQACQLLGIQQVGYSGPYLGLACSH